LEEQLIEVMTELLDEELQADILAVKPKTNNIIYEAGSVPYVYQLEEKEAALPLREQDEMWCLHCYSIFPAGWLKLDFLGNRAGCGSRLKMGEKHCNGGGLGVDIRRASDEFALGSLACCSHTTPAMARRQGYLGEHSADHPSDMQWLVQPGDEMVSG